MPDEICELTIIHGPIAAIGFEHEHLVGILRVYVLIGDLVDIGVCCKTANGTAAAPTRQLGQWARVCGEVVHQPIAINVLNEHVVRRILDGHTFVLVSDFDVVDPHIEAPNVDTIKTAHVRPSDDDIVDLSVGACVYDQMESRRVHEADVVDAELVDVD